MPSAAECRKQAETLSGETLYHRSDGEALVLLLRALELEILADELEQDATLPPTA